MRNHVTKRLIAIILILAVAVSAIPQHESFAKTSSTAFNTKAKVSSLKAKSKTSSSVKLQWKKVTGATGYQIYRATSKKGKYKKVATTKKTQVTNSGLKAQKKYYYKVRAYKKSGKSYKYSRYSSILSVKTLAKTTTQATTTESTTTEKPTTENTTTEKPTTDDSTTEKPTTEAPTTEPSSTEDTSTQDSSTQDTSTEDVSTQDTSTEEDSTTEEPTTEDVFETWQFIDYVEETGNTVSNPDQGFYKPISCSLTKRGLSIGNNTTNDIATMTAYDYQICHLRISLNELSGRSSRISNPQDLEIPQLALSSLDTLLKNMYARNINVVIRMAYDFNGTQNQEPSDFNMILRHIEQASAIFNKYPDTITAIQVGMIGSYGEAWNGIYTDKSYINQVIDKYLTCTDEIPILVRTPRMIYDYLGIFDHVTLNAFNIDLINNYIPAKGSPAYRLGIFNDGYLGDDTDIDTYKSRKEEVAWLSQQTAHLPYGGELTTNSPSLDPDYYQISNWLSEMYSLHLSYLNREFNSNVLNLWRDENYNGGTAYRFVEDHLGYRFILETADVRYSNTSQTFQMDLDISNNGFGNLNRTKQASIILIDKAGNRTTLSNVSTFTGVDSRDDDVVTITAPHVILPQGQYDIYLRIDNGAEHYPIQFANANLWNSDLNANHIGSITVTSK